MAVSFTRVVNSTDVWIKITGDLLTRCSLDQFIDEMVKATREFVQTDPEARILINEMVRTAFQQVDLLKLVTDTIKQSLPDVSKPAEEVKPNAI